MKIFGKLLFILILLNLTGLSAAERPNYINGFTCIGERLFIIVVLQESGGLKVNSVSQETQRSITRGKYICTKEIKEMEFFKSGDNKILQGLEDAVSGRRPIRGLNTKGGVHLSM